MRYAAEITRRFLILCFAFFLILGGLNTTESKAAGGELRPAEWAATLLLKIAPYFEWPSAKRPGLGQPYVVGIFAPGGEDPFNGLLHALARKARLHRHPVEIRPIRTTEQLADIHLLYVPKTAMPVWRASVKRDKPPPILTVGEAADFTAEGGILRLDTSRRAVSVSIANLKQSGIRGDARLLRHFVQEK